MIKPLYKKGNKLVIAGTLGAILFKMLPLLLSIQGFSLSGGVASFVGLSVLLWLASIIILIWGVLLVLKSKGQSRGWVILVLLLNIIGLIIIYSMKDNLSEKKDTTP